MKYKATCTDCYEQIECLYDTKKFPIIWKDFRAVIEVDTEIEAQLIEILNYNNFQTKRTYTELYNLLHK